MTKPVLPIHEISGEDFWKFKSKYLDGKLTKESIKGIEKLFKIGDKSVARICCDEYHSHSYKCVLYYSPETGVVERLLNEISSYKKVMGDIHNISNLDKE